MVGLTHRLWRRLSLNASSLLFVAFVCIAVVAADVWQTLHSREVAIEDGKKDAANLSISIGQHVDDCFDMASTVLTGLANRLTTYGTGADALKGLHDNMVAWAHALPMIDGIFVYDRNGRWIANALERPPPPYSIADREYFVHHASDPSTAIYIGKAVVSRATGRHILAISRRINAPDGGFAGIVSVTVSLDYLEKFLKTFDVGPNGVLSLILPIDQTVLVRVPDGGVVGKQFTAGALQQLAAKAPAGVWIARSRVDGVQRISSYRQSPRYPLIVIIALANSDVLAAWKADARSQFVRTMLLCLLIGAMGCGLAGHLRRRQQAEREARVMDAQYRLLTDNAADIIIRLGLDGICRYASPASHDLLGLPPKDLVGRALLDYVHPEDRPALAAALLAMEEGAERAEATCRLIGSDLRIGRWSEIRLRRLHDPEGRHDVEIQGSIRDVSQNRADQEALRQREAALSALFERTTDTLVVHAVRANGQFPIDRLNSSAAARLGLEESAAIGRSMTEFPGLIAAEDYESALRRCVVERGPIRMTARSSTGDQASYWELTFQPLIEDELRVERILVTSRDISHLKRAEADAVEANRLLLLAEQVAHVGHWRLELPSRKLTWSDEVYRTLGIEPGVTPHFSMAWARYHPEDVAHVQAALATAIEFGKNYEITMRVNREDGVRIVSSKAICETDRNGTVTAVFGVFRDLTDIKKQEEELRQAKEAAEAMTRAKTDFLSTMSHELRTPLTGVLGMIDLLKAQPSVAESRLMLDTLKMSAESLLAILGDILDFSKIESGKLVLEEVELNVAEVVTNVVDLFSTVATKRGLNLHWTGNPADCIRMVRGDPTRLRQVLSNLISNAIKFTNAGDVRLHVTPPAADGRLWRFEITDTGIGLSEETRSRLFDAFSQADASITRRYGGTGLGLAICKRIVEAMGGSIGVDSAIGQGSRFWFDVQLEPLAMAPPTSSEDIANPMSRAPVPLDILVAEDNGVNQMLITAMLGNMGHFTTCVGNGRLAVEAVKRQGFDLVLMDMQMPETDGATATRSIRALAPPLGQVPIIGLTADTVPEHVSFYMAAGLSGFLAKPINLARLRGLLDEITASLPEARRRRRQPPPAVTVAAKPAIAHEGILPPDVSEDRRAFDRRRLDDLESSIGAATTLRLLVSFNRDMSKRIGELHAAGLDGDKAALSSIAHAISGAAANLGAIRLAAAASALSRAIRLGDDYTGLVEGVEIASVMTDDAIRQMEGMRA